MNLEINEEELRRWFNLSPDAQINFWTITQHVESSLHRQDRRYVLGEFLVRQFMRQSGKKPAEPSPRGTG